MRHVKKILALVVALLLTASISSSAFAVDDLCTIRIFSGAQGSVPGGMVSEYKIKRGDTFDKISAIDGYASVASGSKYYPKGLRESGKEEEHNLSFKVEKDEDFVVTYGIKGKQVKYNVRYVDAATGSDLRAASGPYYANVGDRVYVAYIEITGYQPDAYNKVRTLSEDYTFEFRYTRATATTTTTTTTTTAAAAGGGAAVAAGAANANAANAANANAANVNVANANANAAGNPNAANPNANTPAGNANNGAQPAAPAAPVELIDEDAVPLAAPGGDMLTTGTAKVPSAPKVIESNQRSRLPNWALIAGIVVLVGLISILYWYLLFYRKKKKYAGVTEDYQILGFDND